MEYILFLTYRCNLNCSYCFAKELVHNNKMSHLSVTSENIDRVCNYIENDLNRNNRKDNSIVFFGGEPSLVPNIILEIINKTSHLNLKYSIYTNGILLNELPDSLLKQLSSILVAIEGDKEIHERYKPIGSYDKILDNVKQIRDRTDAEIIARITLEEDSNIYVSVKELLKHFDFVHWQIVNKDSFLDSRKFIANYMTNIKQLFAEWLDALKMGEVMNIIPFNRIVLALLSNEEALSFRCGCGSSIQAIDVKGNIYICDECIGKEEYVIGHICDNKFDMIRYKSHLDLFDDCVHCEVSNICLGRCRKSLETQSANHIRVYCELTKALIKMILESIDEIKTTIKDKRITLSRFHTEIYNTEIIP